MLIQIVDGNKKVVAYYSKRTTPVESKYCSYDLETLAIYNALKHFRIYLLGIHFKIFTDCNSIKSTMSKKDLSPRVARWWTFMQDFDFEIIYKKGKHIGHVDFLSRNPVEASISDGIVNESDFPVPTSTSSVVNPLFKNYPNVVNLIDGPQSWLEIAQQNDPETQNLISRVVAGDLDENRYFLQNNLLFYKTQPEKPKLYVPKGCRFSLM